MFFGPSRLVWFGIGSVATWAWIRHHENRDRQLHGQGWCPPRVDYRAQTTQAQNTTSREWNPTMTTGQGQSQAQGQGQGQGSSSTSGAAPRTPPQSPADADQDYERLRQIGRNAEETVSRRLPVVARGAFFWFPPKMTDGCPCLD